MIEQKVFFQEQCYQIMNGWYVYYLLKFWKQFELTFYDKEFQPIDVVSMDCCFYDHKKMNRCLIFDVEVQNRMVNQYFGLVLLLLGNYLKVFRGCWLDSFEMRRLTVCLCLYLCLYQN